jgi:hypothetical protein
MSNRRSNNEVYWGVLGLLLIAAGLIVLTFTVFGMAVPKGWL